MAKLRLEDNLRPARLVYASSRIHDLKHSFGRRLRTEEEAGVKTREVTHMKKATPFGNGLNH